MNILPTIALTLTACTSTPIAPPAADEAISAAIDLAGTDVFPCRDGTWVFAEAGADEPFLRRREPTDRFGAQWSVADDDGRTAFWSLGERGALHLVAVIDEGDRVLTMFDPPLLLAPDRIEPGIPVESAAEMRVHDLGNPRRIKDRGSASRTMVYEDDRMVDGPEGPMRAARIEIRFVAALRLAKVRQEVRLLVVPDLGPLRETSVESLTVLGVLPSETRRELVLRGVE